jgi:hypothetical protein
MVFKYIAGNSIKNILDKKYLKNGSIPIINYVSESNISNINKI